jgi:hypothetical protein
MLQHDRGVSHDEVTSTVLHSVPEPTQLIETDRLNSTVATNHGDEVDQMNHHREQQAYVVIKHTNAGIASETNQSTMSPSSSSRTKRTSLSKVLTNSANNEEASHHGNDELSEVTTDETHE